MTEHNRDPRLSAFVRCFAEAIAAAVLREIDISTSEAVAEASLQSLAEDDACEATQ